MGGDWKFLALVTGKLVVLQDNVTIIFYLVYCITFQQEYIKEGGRVLNTYNSVRINRTYGSRPLK